MIWKTRDDKKIPLEEMSDSHLLNAERFLQNQLVRIDEATESYLHPIFGPQGEIAQECADREMQDLWEYQTRVSTMVMNLNTEIRRRGLKPLPHKRKRNLQEINKISCEEIGTIIEFK